MGFSCNTANPTDMAVYFEEILRIHSMSSS